MPNSVYTPDRLYIHDAVSGTSASVVYGNEDDGLRISIMDDATKEVVASAWIAPPKPETVEVGVIFNVDSAIRRAVQVYTYNALKSLDLRVGDQVMCPVGYGSVQRIGTVVTLTPLEAPVEKKLITERNELP